MDAHPIADNNVVLDVSPSQLAVTGEKIEKMGAWQR